MAKRFLPAVIISLIVFALFYSFPSNQYTAVDGSLRCLPLMNATKWRVHGNNHMLYPVNVVLWSRLMYILFGMKPSDPLTFIRMIESMNSFSASVAVGLFFSILKKVTSNLRMSILGACALAFSNTFIVNAVNSDEPMIGFTVSLISIFFTHAWIKSGNFLLGFIGAFLLSLSMAMYQSMFLIAPSLTLLVLLFSLKDGKTVALRNLILYIFFIGISYFTIYFLSHWIINEEHSLGEILKKIFLLYGFETCGKLSFAKFLAIPFSVVYGILYLDNMKDGIRAFFSEQPLNYTVSMAIVFYILTVFFCIVLTYLYIKIFKKIEREKRIYLMVSLAALVVTMLAPLYWSISYVKILMQPIAAFIAVTAIISSEVYRLSDRRIAIGLKSFLSILLISVILWNANNVLLKMHFQPSNLKEAKELSGILGNESLVILDWDADISNLYCEFYKRPGQQVFSISQEMFALEMDKAKFTQKLKDEIASFKNRGRKVYFLGVLEKSRSRWRYFLEERLGIDYGLFNEYRQSARLIKKFDKTNLYEY